MRTLLAVALLAGAASSPWATARADDPIRVPALDASKGDTSPVRAASAATAAPLRYSLPPRINPLGPSPRLDPRERRAAYLARRWRTRLIFPHPSADGVVRWPYGTTEASVVCSPLYECAILLKPGEIVTAITAGDKTDWSITPQFEGVAGDPRRVTAIVVRPFDSGANLTSNLSVLTNEHRHYSIKLIAVQRGGVPFTGFTYEDDQIAAWARYQNAVGSYSILGGPDSYASACTTGSWVSYQIDGDAPPWRPVGAFTNGRKTCIELPPNIKYTDAPVLEKVNNDAGLFHGPSTQVVNVHRSQNYLIYDGVLDKAELISGVGSAQNKVVITRSGFQ